MHHDTEALLKLYRSFICIRLVEEIEENYVKQGKAFFYMPGKGHEGSAALGEFLLPQDFLACHYRDKALMVARGARPLDFFRNMFCKADSDSAGRQMSAFLHNRALHMISLSGPVTNAALHACGIAAECKTLKRNDGKSPLVYCGLGDGMTQEGEFYEAVLFAAHERLPVLFVIEDNGYAISTRTAGKTFFSTISGDATSFCGLPIERINGSDPAQARLAFESITARIRENSQKKNEIVPALVILKVARLSSHTNSDDQSVYRSTEELAQAAAQCDPLHILEKTLREQGVSQGVFDTIRKEEQDKVFADLEEAARSNEPEPCFDAKRPADFESIAAITLDNDGLFVTRRGLKNEFTVNEAINAVLFDRLARDERVSLFGEDIEDPKGDVFGVTRGLSTAFPGRVLNAPLAEAAIAGISCGRSLAGGKPVAFFQFADFMPVAMNQLFSEIGNMYWRTAGSWESPVLFMVSCGAYRAGLGPFHASTLESMILQIPGIDVFMPSNAEDAAGLLNTAFESQRPTVFFYPKNCLNDRSLVCGAQDLRKAVNPLKLRKIAEGNDITLAGWGNSVELVKNAAVILKQNGKTADVLDLRSLSPWDCDGLVESVKKTGALLIVQENNITCSFASEVAAFTAEYFACSAQKAMPRIRRLSRPDTYVPFHYGNQLAVLPSVASIIETVAEMLGGTVDWQLKTFDRVQDSSVVIVKASGSSPSDEVITIVEWLVEKGAHINQGQIIANMEADKASFEFASPVSGVIAGFFAEAGESLEVGEPLFSVTAESTNNPSPSFVVCEPACEIAREAHIIWAESESRAAMLDSAVFDVVQASEIGIAAVASALPARLVTTTELEKQYGWQDLEKKNGIRQRYWADENEDTVSLGYKAAKKVLSDLNLSVCDLDLIICATGSPVTVSPSLACHIMRRLALDEGEVKTPLAGAYDISAACSGYLYGLLAAWNHLNAQPLSRVLLITSETLSRQAAKADIGTLPIFGDAATATILCSSQTMPLRSVVLRPEVSSLPEDGRVLCIPRNLNETIFMNGPAVFLAAVREMGAILKKTCEVQRIALQDLDLVIPHQANQRIINAIRQKLHLKNEQVFSNIADFGNTSSSSIPLALEQVFEQNTKGTIALCSFGAGFVSGSCILKIT